MELLKAEVQSVIGTFGDDYAVVVRAEEKAFLIYVGKPEVFAIFRELKGVPPQRPMSHEMLCNVLTGFDIEVKMVVISSIVENVFCATLVLSRTDRDGERSEVRLDTRASDAMIVALKTGSQLWVTHEVLDQVEDVTAMLPDDDADDLENTVE